jgi:hypothetical protein
MVREATAMVFNSLFEPFIKERPICVMARTVLQRLLDPGRIDRLFEQTAQRQYTRELLFSGLAELMGDVVLKVEPSVHAAYKNRKEALKVSATALYHKLDRVETGVSAELVRDAARQAEPVIDALKARCRPWLPGYRCKVLDGNHLAATEHRLDELRTLWDAPLPGKALAVLDQERMLVGDVFLSEDGHAQERSLLHQVLATVGRRDLWIADRNFCTYGFLCGIAARGAYFLIRHHAGLPVRPLGRRKRVGHTETGVVYEQAVILTDPETGRQRRIRRITVKLDRPTRDGDRELHLLTNVPRRVGARRLSDLYRKRWTIESAFGEITETLACEIDTLGYPPAALFAFCLALLAYNAVSVLKAALRAVHGEETVAGKLSAYYMTLEIRKAYDGMMVALPPPHWEVFREMTPAQLARFLKEVADNVYLARYEKHPRGPKKKPPKRRRCSNGGHISTARILQQRKQTC